MRVPANLSLKNELTAVNFATSVHERTPPAMLALTVMRKIEQLVVWGITIGLPAICVWIAVLTHRMHQFAPNSRSAPALRRPLF